MYEFSSRMPMLDQMVEGLRSFGMLGCIKLNAKLLKPVFTNSAMFKVQAEIFLENIVGNFSETGSNYKEVEINIFKYFCDYVEDCDDPGKILYFIFWFALCDMALAYPPKGDDLSLKQLSDVI